MKLTISKKWIAISTINYMLFMCLLALKSTSIISDLTTGFICLTATAIYTYLAMIENKLISPILPVLIFDLSFSLYVMMLVKGYYKMTFAQLLLIATCSYIWKIIASSSFSYLNNLTTSNIDLKQQYIRRTSFSLIITLLFTISTLAMLFEWKMAGGIPVLRSDSETFRFTTSYTSYTHFLAILNKIVAALIGAYLVNKGKVSIKQDGLLIAEMVIAELLMVGTAMRGEMIFAPCIIFIVFAVKYHISKKICIVFSIILLIFAGVYPIVRMYSSYGLQYIANLKAISVYPSLFAFTPLYQTLSNNFSILKLDFNIFPDMYHYGYGSYGILPMIPFVDLGKNLSDVQNTVLGNNFYSALTGTFLQPIYADFGYLGCILGTMIIAELVTYAYNNYYKKHTLFSLIFCAYVFYQSLWIFYAQTFDLVFFFYSIIIWIILNTYVTQ